MSDLMKPVKVTYIGKREPWFDRLYDTGLSFVCGQSRVLPWDMAPKFLRHADLFEEYQGEPKDDEAQVDETTDDEAAADDTKKLLDEQSEKDKAKNNKQVELQALYDQVASMDKDGLKNFAEANYQQKINKSKSLDNLRAEVTGMIDQFGVV